MPLSSLQAAVGSLVVATIALVVGLGIMSPHAGGEVVAYAGTAVAALFTIANAIVHHGVSTATKSDATPTGKIKLG